MPKTPESAKQIGITNKKKYGEDFYKNIGRLGGKAKNPNKGFGYKKQKELKNDA